MAYNDFHQHTYKIIRIGGTGHEISHEVVVGSRAAFAAQQNLEEQGLLVSVWNITKGVEEWNTLTGVGKDD